MKTTTQEVISRSNMKNNERVKMSVDLDGLPHIINMVTHLYADPDSACIREYAANAYDSHVLAKQSRPIEITLPTIAKPTLEIKDYGVGMSKADIADIYSKYGASTKRHSNDYIGAFGLGCKAGLSLSPTFTIVSIKDGRKVVANIHRGEDGVGEIEFVHESDTTDHSGVTVKIAIHGDMKTMNAYKAKARAIFITWPSDSVLIDGKKPELSIDNDADFVNIGGVAHLSRKANTSAEENARNWYRTPQNGSLIIAMGGIGYYVDREQTNVLLSKMNVDTLNANMRSFVGSFKSAVLSSLTLVVEAEMNSLDLITSRESIRWSGRSTNTVVKALNKIVQEIPKSLAADFKDCTTRIEVLSKNTQDFAQLFRSVYAEVEWQGEKLPRAVRFALPSQECYSDASEDNFIFRYNAQGERIPVLRNTSSPYFDFGFLEANRSYGNATADSVHWYFVQVEDVEEIKSKVSGFANTFVEDLRATGDAPYRSTVNIVASIGDIFANEWFKAVFDNQSNMKTIHIDDLVERSRSRRRITAEANRSARVRNNVKMALTYPTAIVDENGVMRFELLTTKEVDALATTMEAKVYLDDNNYIRDDGTHTYLLTNLKAFVPAKSIIVGMKSNRKFSALVARIESETFNLKDAISEEMNNFVKTVTLEEYVNVSSAFKEWNMPKINVSDLNDGFLKRMMTPANNPGSIVRMHKLGVVSSYGNAYISKENQNWNKPMIRKGVKIFNTCILAFGGSKDYGTDGDAYSKALTSYLNGLNSAVEKIAK